MRIDLDEVLENTYRLIPAALCGQVPRLVHSRALGQHHSSACQHNQKSHHARIYSRKLLHASNAGAFGYMDKLICLHTGQFLQLTYGPSDLDVRRGHRSKAEM